LIQPQTVPSCLSSKLRTCWLRGYGGSDCELQFAEYILKNAKVLDSMKISASSGDLNLNIYEAPNVNETSFVSKGL